MDRHLLALLFLATAPALTAAQSAPPASGGVADPAAPSIPPVYQSAFGTSPKGVVTDLQSWAEANATVGQFQRGHMDIVRWERAQEAAAQATDAPPSSSHQESTR